MVIRAEGQEGPEVAPLSCSSSPSAYTSSSSCLHPVTLNTQSGRVSAEQWAPGITVQGLGVNKHCRSQRSSRNMGWVTRAIFTLLSSYIPTHMNPAAHASGVRSLCISRRRRIFTTIRERINSGTVLSMSTPSVMTRCARTMVLG
jgi:hypothetical protein